MQENLVIVESPAKAKTIEKFLGKDYIVKSSFGHIRDLSKKDLGIDIAEGFRPIYEVPADKKKVVDELARLSKEKTCWKWATVLPSLPGRSTSKSETAISMQT